jgi:hypothetical protein
LKTDSYRFGKSNAERVPTVAHAIEQIRKRKTGRAAGSLFAAKPLQFQESMDLMERMEEPGVWKASCRACSCATRQSFGKLGGDPSSDFEGVM